MESLIKVRLGDIAEVQTGPFGSQLHQRDYKSSGTPIITVEHLGENCIVHENLPLVGDMDKERLNKYTLREGDIVFSRVGSVDRRAYVSNKEEGWLFSGRCLRVRANISRINPRFLSYYFGQNSFKEYIRMIAVGATMPSLNTDILENILISCPSLPTQDVIARVLSCLDDKVNLLHHQNQTLESILRALWRQWFLEEAQDFWESGSLGDIAKNLRQTVDPSEMDDGIPYIGLEHMPQRCIALSDWATDYELASQKFAFKKGEILFGKLRPYFHKVGVAPMDGICSTDILVIVPKSQRWFGYVLGIVSSIDFVNAMDSGSEGTRMPRTGWSHMASYEVKIPPENLVLQYNEFITPMIAKIRNNIMEIRSLCTMRDTLLPKLMNGEIQVKTA